MIYSIVLRLGLLSGQFCPQKSSPDFCCGEDFQDRIDATQNPGTHSSRLKGLLTLSKQSMPSIQDRVLKVIATSKHIPLEIVQPDSSFESLAIDSLDRLNILFDLESEFDIEINDEEAKEVKDIREMIEGVTKLVEAKNAPAPAE